MKAKKKIKVKYVYLTIESAYCNNSVNITDVQSERKEFSFLRQEKKTCS